MGYPGTPQGFYNVDTTVERRSTGFEALEADVTLPEFVNELGAIQAQYNWYVTENGRIRASQRSDVSGRVFNPLTAVLFTQHGEFFLDDKWMQAAVPLKMSLNDCGDLIAACNYDWDASTRQGAIRQDILSALNLVPKTRPVSTTSLSFSHWFARHYRKRSPGSTNA
jgi:hypothetical protein